jgi:hypothetical protein
MMNIAEILEHAKSLSREERHELVNMLVELDKKPTIKTGAEIAAMLREMGPIETANPEIEDPVEWVEAQRQKEADRLKPFWDVE